MLYEGQDKYEQFIPQMEAIKDQLMELCDGSGMKLHDDIYTFQMVSDYERTGMSMPIIKSAQYAAMLAHALGDEYGLTEPYPCPGCEPEDMIGDTMHAGTQICPHVVWHTVHKRCKTKEEAVMDAMQLIGLPGREMKVKTGKGKAITKADLHALSGPEVKKMVDGHEVVLDAIISRSDPIRPKLKKVWDRYIAMTTAWRVDPGDDPEARSRAAPVMRDAVELFFAAFLDIDTTEDIMPYMHHAAWHFPMWMERHGCIDHYSAQCMEHGNREIKQGFRQGSNHQPQRMLRSGKMTLSRTGQEKTDKVKKEMAAKAIKRKSVMAERADKHKKQK
eukprot:jgi/Tetstr1/421321/TSEL_012292.t1